MRNEWLDRALGETPEAFSRRIDQTLHHLEEEKTMKRFTLRTALVTLLVIALLGTVAYAVISQGMEWYYSNRFTAYQEHEPEKHEAIMSRLQAVNVQDALEDPLVNVEVREVSWVPEHQVLVISLAASVKDTGKAELHPEWNLDADGSYVGAENLALYADDPEARAEHWLWTEAGFGPVEEVMADSAKQLLLFDASDVYLGTAEGGLGLMGDMSSVDCYLNEAGEVMTVIEARIAQTQQIREHVAQHNGVLQVSVPYTVTLYSEDDQQMHDSRYTKSVTFEIEVK